MAIKTLDEYLATIPNDYNRARMVDVLVWVGLTYPELELRIAWNQPMFTHHGTYIIGFSAASRHMAVAPERATMIRFEPVMRERGTDFGKMFARHSPGTNPSTTNSLTRSFRTSSQTNATSRRSGAPRSTNSRPPRPSHLASSRPPSASARQTMGSSPIHSSKSFSATPTTPRPGIRSSSSTSNLSRPCGTTRRTRTMCTRSTK